MPPSNPAPVRRVLVVEPAAHVRLGHFPVLAGELATALVDLGCDVEMLTRLGWCLDGEPGFAPVRIRTFGRGARVRWRLAELLGRLPPSSLGTRLLVRGQTAATVREARRLVRRAGFDDVVVTMGTHPYVADRIADRGRWLLYRFTPPREGAPPQRRPARRGAPRVRIVTSVPEIAAAWAVSAPALRPVVIPFIAARPRLPIPDARARLGLAGTAPTALVFGDHARKDLDLVWRAFSRLPQWQLLLAGAGGEHGGPAGAYRAWAACHGALALDPICFDGFVDEQTRSLLHAAADVVVISLVSDPHTDSGNLVDAVAWGRSVVCSDRCAAADVVRRCALGTVFPPGDEDGLVEALGAVGWPPPPTAVAAARAELGSRVVAERNLRALDEIGPRGASR